MYMTLIDWIPAISMTSLLAIALWLLRSVISTRLKASVKHEFDQKLEAQRASLRNNEEAFKADLQSKANEIAALRSGALTGLASRQAALDARRIQAVDQLWSAILALAPAKAVSATMAIVKFEAAAKLSAKNPRAREMFGALGGQLDLTNLGSKSAAAARPYVSEMAWALFSAYQAIVSVAVLKQQILKSGLGMTEIVDIDTIKRLVAAALPHQAEFVAKHDTGAYHYLLDELESRLLGELRTVLKGVDSDKASVKQAAEILKESERVMTSLAHSSESNTPGNAGLDSILTRETAND
jgi:hypothetical protein